jgi:LCP family protein required for cell wall assembly
VKLIPHSRRGALWRFAAGAVIVIGFTAATTAVAGLLQFKQIEDFFNRTQAFQNVPVKIPDPGAAQTLLVIGSDHRAGTPFKSALTDTMILVRIDPHSSTINVLSVPRDLKVQLPGGTNKLNAAYSEGGPRLLIKTLQQQVFGGLEVNHVLDVNFGGFEKLVNAIGCVYTDVDHRYYNNTATTDYSSIDIQPGYQKLCGAPALSFVRFRHTDSDIVRNARQQDFLRWAKEQYSAGQLLSNRDKLLKIFGANVQTDHTLHTVDGLINLFNLIVFSDAHSIKQIKFPSVFLPCGTTTSTTGFIAQTPCYVAPRSSAAERQVYKDLITPTVAKTHTARKHRKRTKLSTAGLSADVADGRSQVAAISHVPFPVYYPRLVYGGAHYCLSIIANCDELPNPQSEYTGSYPRAYHIRGAGHSYSAYRMTLDINSLLGEYYGVQGVDWLNPPILNNPSSTRIVDGKKLMLFYNGSKLTLVAWRTATASYWISNSLTDTLDNAQMLEIAASLTRAR